MTLREACEGLRKAQRKALDLDEMEKRAKENVVRILKEVVGGLENGDRS